MLITEVSTSTNEGWIMTSAQNLPEPGAHPTILSEPPDPFSEVRSRTSTRRLGVALFIIGFGWLFANTMLTNVLLSAKIQILAPDDKVLVLGVATALAGIGTTIAVFVWGTVSDLTRSRFGRRTPWILFGGVCGALFLVLMALTTTTGAFVAAFVAYGLTFNALCAAVLAIFADRIPREKRGTYSTVYGGAQLIGGGIGAVFAAQFVFKPNSAFFMAAGILIVIVVAFLLLAPDYSSKDMPRDKLDIRGLLAAFKFPRKAPDFYWAFVGRFTLLLGLYAVQNFSLYILEDYVHLTGSTLQNVIKLSSGAGVLALVIGTVIAGPLSDRIHRRKVPIFAASILFAVAITIPLIWPTALAMILFGVVSSLGLGAFLSVDTALMTEVIPVGDSNGKNLGILNTANTVPQIIAPLLTAGVVSIGLGYGPVFIAALIFVLVGAFSIFKIKSVR
jgi:MFS family permease